MRPQIADSPGHLGSVRTLRTFRNMDDLSRFFSDCRGRPQAAYSVEILHVLLSERSLGAALRLKTALNSMSNLTDLILELPSTFPSSVLRDVRLPQLALFKSNVRHSDLVRFLLEHSDLHANERMKLTSLSIGNCGCSSACPLQACRLDTVEELECMVECASALVRPRLDRLVLQHHAASPSAIPIFQRLIASPLLGYLSIEVRASERKVLELIPTFAPGLYTLMIVEVEVNQELRSLRSITSDHKGWVNMLRRLPRLNTLMIRTPWFMVSAGDVEEERKQIMRWTCGRYEQCPGYGRTRNLQRIGMHYGPQTGGVMSHWRLSEEWERYAHVPSTDSENYLS